MHCSRTSSVWLCCEEDFLYSLMFCLSVWLSQSTDLSLPSLISKDEDCCGYTLLISFITVFLNTAVSDTCVNNAERTSAVNTAHTWPVVSTIFAPSSSHLYP